MLMLRKAVFAAGLLSAMAQAAPKDFKAVCTDPNLTENQKLTVGVILEQLKLPDKLTAENCQAAETKLATTKSMKIAATKFRQHGFATIPLNPIRDLTPVASLTNLESLDLLISTTDLKPLLELKNLKSLSITPEAHAGFHGVAGETIPLWPVNALRNLDSLTLHWVGLSDLNQIRDLTQLKRLDVSSNRVGSLWELGRFTQLESLNVGGNHLASLIGIGNQPNLRVLKADGTDIGNLEGLDGLTGLRELSCGACAHLTDIGGISRLTTLEKVSFDSILYRGPLRNLAPVSSLTNLRSLSIWGQRVNDLSPLANLTKLTNLRAGENQIVELEPLAGLTNLERIDLFENFVGNLRPLAQMTKLKFLRVDSNRVTFLDGLDGLTNMEELRISNNNLQNLYALKNWTKLKKFIARSNAFGNLEPLANLVKLNEVDVSYTSVTNVAPLANHKDLGVLWIQGRNSVDVTPVKPLETPHLNSEGQTIRLYVYQ